jgi:hypothetical protein
MGFVQKNALNTPFAVSKSSFGIVIHMGDRDKSIIGHKTYDVSYRMPAPVFRDVFSLNLNAADWDVPLNNITFSITFPKLFDPSKIDVYGGQFKNSSFSEN